MKLDPKHASIPLVAVAGALALGACGGDDSTTDTSAATTETTTTDAAADTTASDLPQGSEHVEIDPAEFTTKIDNPYWPMAVGSKWVYSETDSEGAEQKVVVTVTPETKQIANGVEAVVVHDVVTEDGQPTEVTDDWYAQDSEGNIWYMGEDTAEYENGKISSHSGSFEAGVDGAEPGIVVPADPQPGMEYRQEYYKGEAEDIGAIVATDTQAEVPAGHYKPTLMTKDTNPLEPKVLEFKFYAEGVGPVRAVSVSGGSDREELLSYTPGK